MGVCCYGAITTTTGLSCPVVVVDVCGADFGGTFRWRCYAGQRQQASWRALRERIEEKEDNRWHTQKLMIWFMRGKIEDSGRELFIEGPIIGIIMPCRRKGMRIYNYQLTACRSVIFSCYNMIRLVGDRRSKNRGSINMLFTITSQLIISGF